MMGVPTNYQLLAEHPDFATADLSTLTHAVVGGATMPEQLLRTWHARGVRVTQGYGLTEAGPNVLACPPTTPPPTWARSASPTRTSRWRSPTPPPASW